MIAMDGFSDERPGDISHLPGGYPQTRTNELCDCARCVGERTRTKTEFSVADFAARNRDWREYARGWSGL